MSDRVCACCGQTLPPEIEVHSRLTRTQFQIFERVRRAGSHGVLAQTLFEHLYADDPNGGPLTGMCAVHVLINYTNRRLAPFGWRIAAPRGRCQPSRYTLQRVSERVDA